MYRPVPSGAADAGTGGRPRHTIRSCLHIMPTNAHRTRGNVDHSAGFAEKPTEKPTEKRSVSVSFFFAFFFKTRPKPTDVLVRNRKTNRAIFYFRFTTLAVEMESVRYMRKLEMCRVQEKNLIPYSQYYWYIHVHQM